MKNRRIIFLLKPFDKPFGGAGVLYKHVDLLNQHGFHAFIALSEKPSVDYYDFNIPLLIHNDSIELEPSDICVIPEVFPDYMEALRSIRAKKIMFCQNQYYLPFKQNPEIGILEYPVDSFIVSSEALRTFFYDVYGIANIPLIPYAIDTQVYVSVQNKVRQIAFMPRKLPAEAKFIEATFKRMYKRYSEIPWVSIDNTTMKRSAEIMGESEIFLSLSHQESFGLPPLEAMSCGCLVVGFHGDGGREYMNNGNGWWAETGDWRACVHGLASALDLVEMGGEELLLMKTKMAQTVNKYSPERMEQELLKYWEDEIKIPF